MRVTSVELSCRSAGVALPRGGCDDLRRLLHEAAIGCFMGDEMRLWRRIARCGTVLVALVTVVAAGQAAGAEPTSPTPPPAPISVPGGLVPGQAAVAGDCAMAGVTCKPALPGSCTGDVSQSIAPASVKVFLGATRTIVTVPFATYVENVLPNEWIASWDGDALKAGAVAVKSYAWYWVTHFGGYLDGDPANCFDVTDDQDFQVYQANSALARTTAVVQQTWPVAARVGGKIVQTFYRSYLHSSSESCGAYADGITMSQYGTQRGEHRKQVQRHPRQVLLPRSAAGQRESAAHAARLPVPAAKHPRHVSCRQLVTRRRVRHELQLRKAR